jgi:hypothetical protein
LPEVNRHQREAGDVAAGVRQALGQSVTHRIRIGDKYDGDGAGGAFRLACAQAGHRDNHIDFAFGKLLRQGAIPLRLFGGKTVVQFDVLAFDVAKLVKRLGQGAQIFRFLLGVAGVPKHADARKRFSLLRARDARHAAAVLARSVMNSRRLIRSPRRFRLSCRPQ